MARLDTVLFADLDMPVSRARHRRISHPLAFSC